jgi:hypothetical protein
MSLWANQWGTTAGEQQLDFPCDRLVERPDAVLFRAVTVDAPPAAIFRWLCQLRVAPYSYDWIDNWGRQSPSQLTPGLDRLEIGEDLMTIFTLVDFRRGEHLTMQIKRGTRAHRIFGDIAGTYLIVPRTARSSRLVVKLLARYPPGLLGRMMSLFLPWGDLVMMRRQLLNLKELVEAPPEATRDEVP